MLILSFIMIYPVFWMVFSSFKPESEIFSTANILPKEWTLENYISGWQGGGGVDFGVYLGNSFIVAIGVVLGSLFIASITGFALAKLKFKMRNVFLAITVLTIMLPVQVTIIPQFIIFQNIGWVDTFLPLIVPAFVGVGVTPFFIFLMVQFARGLPKELDEAAIIDGCNTFQLFWHIILPLSKPVLITISIFAFYWTWDDLFGQLIYLNSPENFTVSTGLNMFLDNSVGGESAWGGLFAMSTISLLPVIVVFLILQKYIVEGIATTGTD